MSRLEQHRVRGHLEAAGVQVFERLNHGRDQIGATSDRFREYHVRARAGFERTDAPDEVVEPAAEARARHLLDR